MARSYKELRNKMSPERRERSARRAQAILLAMTLAELREKYAGLTQTAMAEELDVTQSAISQLERRNDILLSNLRQYIEALGGKLEIRANFPGGESVRIDDYEERATV